MNYTKETAEVLMEIGAAIYGTTLLILMYLWEKRKEKKIDKHKQNTRNNNGRTSKRRTRRI